MVSYDRRLSDMTVTDAGALSEARAASCHEPPLFITRYGTRVAALVTVEFYERAMVALEDGEAKAARVALAAKRPEAVSTT